MTKYHTTIVSVFVGDSIVEDFYAWPQRYPLPADNVFNVESADDIPEDCIDLMVNDDTEAERLLALMIALDEYDIAMYATVNETTIEIGRSREYLVVDDETADRLWDDALESYIDECILHELPERYRSYFDSEAWKKDARIDGRAHSLDRYDGNELCEHVGSTIYYIYRQN